MVLPASVRIALGFLTRMPTSQARVEDASFGRALAWFPAVGAALGMSLFVLDFVLQSWMTAPVRAVLLVTLWAAVTGGLHLDGLADVFDAFSGGRGDRNRTLEIMRDSRIGAHGATALSLCLIAKVVCVAEIAAQHREALLLAAPVFARSAVVALLLVYPYARPQGLGTLFRTHGRWRDWAWGQLAVLLVCVSGGVLVLIPALVCVLTCFALGHFASRRLGGLTGDVYGAAIELGELSCLLAATLHAR